jgi:hypothetical protein
MKQRNYNCIIFSNEVVFKEKFNTMLGIYCRRIKAPGTMPIPSCFAPTLLMSLRISFTVSFHLFAGTFREKESGHRCSERTKC